MKRAILRLWSIESHIRAHIAVSRWFYFRVGVIGKAVSVAMDRVLLMAYGIDLLSCSIAIRALSIGHPGGILLGGNGIVSAGRVAIMAGVKFVGRSPDDAEYIARQRARRTFVFGDNVVIGANSVVIGPVTICSNVIVGSMSLVNRDITEPGVYVGAPARKVSDMAGEEWVSHLQPPAGERA